MGLKAQLDGINSQISLLSYEARLLNLLLDNNGSLPIPLPTPVTNDIPIQKLRSVQLSVEQTAAQLRQLRSQLSSRKSTLNLKVDMEKSLEFLYNTGGISRFQYLKASDEVQQISSQIHQSQEQINVILSQAGRQLNGIQRQLISLEARRIDLKEENTNLLLLANSPGRIFNISAQPGSVISAGSKLMRIVPEGGLKASVFLSNSDLGFVSIGQKVKLSVSSFPAGEYGYISANVTRIGADSLQRSSSNQNVPTNTYPIEVTLNTSSDRNLFFLD